MRRASLVLAVLALSAGCARPYHADVLEKIESSEEAFLIPLTGDTTQQSSFDSEDFLSKQFVATKEVIIPYRWHQQGYYGWVGEWIPAARLIKVDRSPVTRIWTADKDSGTSDKNEAIWVMTSDSVEFSTGWTCTARIKDAKSAVRFLYNYPAGTLKDVMDTEVRAKIQSVFGLAVTDRPMQEMREKATPVFQTVETEVKKFFEERGITITNLGIEGGYRYKDKNIQESLNRVFQAAQDKEIAKAKVASQEELNKAVKLEAEGLAEAARMKAKGESDAAKTKAEGEAAATKTIADAKSYELDKANLNPDFYYRLKQMEVELQRLKVWDGKYPSTLFQGMSDKNVLLQLPVQNSK